MCEAFHTPRTIPQAIWPRSETVAHVRSPAFPSRLCFVFPSLTWSALPTPPGSCSHRHCLRLSDLLGGYQIAVVGSGAGYIHAYLAAAYALKSETERAAAELAAARKLDGEGSWRSVAKLRASTRYEATNIRTLAEATYYAGLRKAGMLEK